LAQDLNSELKTGYLAYQYKAAEMSDVDAGDPDNGEHHLYFTSFSYADLVPAENAVAPTVQTSFELQQNSPNPFNPETKIAFSIDEAAHVELAIYNVKGQKVRTLVNEEMQAGSHTQMWNGMNDNNQSVSSGVYFYSLKVNDRVETKKMVLMN